MSLPSHAELHQETVQDHYLSVRVNGHARTEFNTEGEMFCIVCDEDLPGDPNFWEIVGKGAFRVFEVFVSVVALIVSMPLMLFLAAITRFCSPGFPLFFQRRVALYDLKNGEELVNHNKFHIVHSMPCPRKRYWLPKTFSFVKFRTMYADAKIRFPELYNYNYSREEIGRIPFKREADPRVTRVGKWLRALTVDELPNFWNVVTGEMRLVGPRPEVPEMLSNYRPDQMRKFTVKPGITGLAQINGRGRLSFQETVAYDLQYVDSRSLVLDIKILLITIWKVFTKHGAF